MQSQKCHNYNLMFLKKSDKEYIKQTKYMQKLKITSNISYQKHNNSLTISIKEELKQDLQNF